MRKNIAAIAILLIFCLAGCSYSAEKTYYKDTADYDKIWSLTGFNHGYEDKSPLFPDTLTGYNVEDFYCRYDEQLPLGEGVQIFLEIRYDENDFPAQQERISKMATEDAENFTESGFSAYVLQSGDNGRYEYALIDDGEKTVYYIFLYNLPKKEIEITKNLLPKNYTDYTE